MTTWSQQRMSGASIAPRIGKYEAIPQTYHESRVKETNPELFSFETVSVGDTGGQLFFVPLDESSKENAEFILEAIKFYIQNH
jgi:hypothetical protein